jgi:hypothetical protein
MVTHTRPDGYHWLLHDDISGTAGVDESISLWRSVQRLAFAWIVRIYTRASDRAIGLRPRGGHAVLIFVTSLYFECLVSFGKIARIPNQHNR